MIGLKRQLVRKTQYKHKGDTIEREEATTVVDEALAEIGSNGGLTKQTMITQVTDSLYKQLIRAYEERMPTEEGPHSLDEIRGQAFKRFEKLGFPTVKHEDWKYTNVQPLISQNYLLDTSTSQAEVAIGKAAIPNLDTYRVVLVDGIFNAELSSGIDVPGLHILPIQEAFDQLSFAKYFAEYADKTDNPFVALNTALFKSGVFITVTKNSVLEKPIHIIHVASATEPLFTQTRNLYVIEANAEAELIESFITEDNAANNLNSLVSEIVVHENAKLHHYYLQLAGKQSSYINHTEIYQKKYSLYNNYNCSFPGSAFVRNNINVRLDDSQVESHLYGVTLTAGNQFVDNHTVVDHLKPHCESYEWYKNITQDTSTAVFNGKIFVRLDAQKTNAFQQNNNMLIGEKSAIYTKPQLEIFADDVKCSHGCTIGQFDNQALFYLRSRGISEAQARVLLVHAFAFDVTNRFANATVRKYVEHLVEQGLENG
ncbi:Fe-S cluster assembly protein SufD [Parapedobacter tibetensis]|uniref:Fe-S cluster assembly protein SufD n=1 Tax=Parapedobacter tibetensis TaxID=2972951 RepID=UPI00214D2890|nr:Fe-S cluster assembly protein SufD [Parapedobacter tibetensis]